MFPAHTLLSLDEAAALVPWMQPYPAPLFVPYVTAATSSSPPEVMDDLAVTLLQNLTFDMDAIGRELHRQTRDTDQIRQDFIRNGIDSSLAGKWSRRPPPGFYGESGGFGGPLASLENRQAVGAAANGSKDSVETMTVTSADDRGRVRRPPRRKQKENEDYCVFCFNNHEPQEVYLGHALHDSQGGVECPRLRQYVCPYCQATDRQAHTKKYCPSKPIITPEDLAMPQEPRGTGTVSGRVVASATASIRACQPSITPGGGKRALRF